MDPEAKKPENARSPGAKALVMISAGQPFS